MGNKRKQKFIGLLAQKALNGEISQAFFKKLELAVNYSDEFKVKELGDGAALAVVDWLKRRGLERDWTFHKRACPECSKESFAFENKDLMLVICPNCMGDKPAVTVPVTPQTQWLQGLSDEAKAIILREKTPFPLPVTSPIQQQPGLSAQAMKIILAATSRLEKISSETK